jgi:hypothetical protein
MSGGSLHFSANQTQQKRRAKKSPLLSGLEIYFSERE